MLTALWPAALCVCECVSSWWRRLLEELCVFWMNEQRRSSCWSSEILFTCWKQTETFCWILSWCHQWCQFTEQLWWWWWWWWWRVFLLFILTEGSGTHQETSGIILSLNPRLFILFVCVISVMLNHFFLLNIKFISVTKEVTSSLNPDLCLQVNSLLSLNNLCSYYHSLLVLHLHTCE